MSLEVCSSVEIDKTPLFKGDCPSCEEHHGLYRLGEQDNFTDRPFILYNCDGCNSTLILDSILDYNL